MTESELLEYVRVGIDNNIMVFDNAAKNGKLSLRLLALMKEVALVNKIMIENIIIPVNYKVDDFYKASKGSFPTGKERVIVAVGPPCGVSDDHHVLLGCY